MSEQSDLRPERLEDGPTAVGIGGAGPNLVCRDEHTVRAVGAAESVRDEEQTEPVGPIVEALNEHWAADRIRAFGASNWTTRRLDEANAYASERGLELHPELASAAE